MTGPARDLATSRWHDADLDPCRARTGATDRGTVYRVRDRDIRAAVAARIRQRLARQTHLLVDEVEVRNTGHRMDLLLVNDCMTAFELKSDVDTLRRLTGQAVAYGLVSNRAVLVCGSRHIEQAMATVPDWWEVWQVTEHAGRSTTRTVRAGRVNRDIDPRALAGLLLREEIADELYWLGAARMSGASVDAMRDRLAVAVSVPELGRRVRRRLLERVAWQGRALSYVAAPVAPPTPLDPTPALPDYRNWALVPVG